jgi:hypothetical protein
MKLKISNLQLKSNGPWNLNLKLKELRGLRFYNLKERCNPKLTWLKVSRENSFLKVRVKLQVFFKKLRVCANHSIVSQNPST